MRCRYCQNLSIEHLVDLAKEEFEAERFPSRAFYQHHVSVTALEESAEQGCDLCRLIVKGLDTEMMTIWDEETFSYKRSEFTTVLGHARSCTDAYDIRVSINTQHVDTHSSLADVLMLDILYVKLGMASSHDETSASPRIGSDYSDSLVDLFPVVLFLLTSPRGKPIHLQQFRIGRSEVGELDSPMSFDVARSWIATCVEEHGDSCATASADPLLPTRVIDVGNAGTVKLFISDGARAKYIALSHCWGGPIATVLRRENLTQFSEDIQEDQLALNFRDAVDVARKLGIQYLWIDSLCIIQNDSDDWARESEKMAEVYQNAHVTICVLTSPKSAHGIFSRLPATNELMNHGVAIPVGGNDVVTAQLYKPKATESLFNLDREAPLNMRAWCLQESVMSRRIIYFGSTQIYWGCCQGFKAADEVPGPSLFLNAGSGPTTLNDAFIASQRQPLPFHGRLLQDLLHKYYSLVRQYTARKITFDKDKLSALSGLARRLHPIIGGDYIAGIWTVDVAQGILWSAADSTGAGIRPVQPFRAPSWSWVATNDPVYVRKLFKPKELTQCKVNTIELVNYELVPKDKSVPYGEVVSGFIVVRGPTARLRRVQGFKVEEGPTETDAKAYFDETEWAGWTWRMPSLFAPGLPEVKAVDGIYVAYGAPSTFQDPNVKVLGKKKDYVVLMARKLDTCNPQSMRKESRVQCLILDQAPSEVVDNMKVYRRVGYLEPLRMAGQSSIEWTQETLKII